LALTSPTGGGRSVGIVRSRTKATEFSLVYPPEFPKWSLRGFLTTSCTCFMLFLIYIIQNKTRVTT